MNTNIFLPSAIQNKPSLAARGKTHACSAHNATLARLSLAALVRVAILAPLFLALLSGCGFFGKDLDPGPAPAKAQNVVRSAYSQMGKNYRLGGASPAKGFDCSGLIWWAYQQNGVKVPRITQDQAKSGKSVAKNSPRAGDIVVFRLKDSPRGLHTGLYAGGGSFIHSPRRGEKVRMESLNVSYWQDRLIAVRRVLN